MDLMYDYWMSNDIRSRLILLRRWVFLKRWLCLILSLLLTFSCVSLCFASGSLTDEDEDYLLKVSEEFSGSNASYYAKMYGVPGRKYPDPTPSDFNSSSPAIYKARLLSGSSIYSGTDLKKEQTAPSQSVPKDKYKIYTASREVDVDVLAVLPAYLIVRCGNKVGYAMRRSFKVEKVVPVDIVNTPPFNTTVQNWVATAGADGCAVRSSMEKTDNNIVFSLTPGAQFAVWQFYDGWAVVDMWKTRGYVEASSIAALTPISPTDEPLNDETPISAYTSYFKVPQDQKNKDDVKDYTTRVANIRFGCAQISANPIPAGGTFSDRNTMAPYNARRYGYVGDPDNGGLLGGGTCQVSSTLYNAVLKLPGLKIVNRHPHGGDGACPYLPCHSDAAVGAVDKGLWFSFTNTYDFPIRIETHVDDGGALTIEIFRAD